ncbi:putative Lovastatin diketide synthase LovF [Seiridium unicorne]|uniref:Lovastatin diketide synthase LovF n=1 Tax=Seiridium unicorne TaxID=138068 RepID=A0ABR2USH9_9PEZI
MAQDLWSSFRDLRNQDQGPTASWKTYVLKDVRLRYLEEVSSISGCRIHMDSADWNAAVQPKVQGTLNLHEAIPSSDLDFFILFSSYGSIAGQWGQANYVAANTFLDAFVQYRHHNGLVASVIDVGDMGDASFVSQNQDVIAKALAAALANFLIKDEDFIALNRPFESLGMDSLVAMEVRNWLRRQVGVELSTIAITQSPSLWDLSEHVKLGLAGGD